VQLSVSYDPEGVSSYLGEEDVSSEIRGDQVTRAVSAVSSVPAVRTRLVALQRQLAEGRAMLSSRAVTSDGGPTRRAGEDFLDRVGPIPAPGVATTRTSPRVWLTTTTVYWPTYAAATIWIRRGQSRRCERLRTR